MATSTSPKRTTPTMTDSGSEYFAVLSENQGMTALTTQGVWSKFLRSDNQQSVSVFTKDLGMPDKKERERTLSELNGLKQLNHPNIVRILAYRIKKDTTQLEIVTKFYGETLATQISDCKRRGCPALPINDILSVSLNMADALSYLQEKGIVHNQIRPSCIFAGEKNSEIGSQSYLLGDFDLARKQLNEPKRSLYTAPELYNKDAKPTHQSDLYSLGVVMYTLYSGKDLFPTQSSNGIVMTDEQLGDLKLKFQGTPPPIELSRDSSGRSSPATKVKLDENVFYPQQSHQESDSATTAAGAVTANVSIEPDVRTFPHQLRSVVQGLLATEPGSRTSTSILLQRLAYLAKPVSVFENHRNRVLQLFFPSPTTSIADVTAALVQHYQLDKNEIYFIHQDFNHVVAALESKGRDNIKVPQSAAYNVLQNVNYSSSENVLPIKLVVKKEGCENGTQYVTSWPETRVTEAEVEEFTLIEPSAAEVQSQNLDRQVKTCQHMAWVDKQQCETAIALRRYLEIYRQEMNTTIIQSEEALCTCNVFFKLCRTQKAVLKTIAESSGNGPMDELDTILPSESGPDMQGGDSQAVNSAKHWLRNTDPSDTSGAIQQLAKETQKLKDIAARSTTLLEVTESTLTKGADADLCHQSAINCHLNIMGKAQALNNTLLDSLSKVKILMPHMKDLLQERTSEAKKLERIKTLLFTHQNRMTAHATKKAHKLEMEMQALQTTKADTSSQRQMLEAELERNQQLIVALEDQVSNLRTTMTDQNCDHETEMERVKAEFREREGEHDTQVAALRQEIMALRDQAQMLEEEFLETSQAADETRATEARKVTELERMLASSNTEREATVQDLTEKLSVLESDLIFAEGKLETAEQANEDLLQQMLRTGDRHLVELQTKDSFAAALKLELDYERKLAESLKGRTTSLEKELQELHEQLEDALSGQDDSAREITIQEQNETISTLRIQLTGRDVTIAKLSEELAKEKMAVEKHQNQVTKLSAEISELDEELKSVLVSKEELIEESEDVKTVNLNLQEELTELRCDIAQHRANAITNSALRQDKSMLEETVSKLTATLAQFESSADELQDQLVVTRSELDKVRKDQADADAYAAQTVSDFNTANEKLQVLEQELAAVKQDAVAKEEYMTVEFEKRKEEMADEIVKLNAEMVADRRRHETAMRDCTATTHELEEQLEELLREARTGGATKPAKAANGSAAASKPKFKYDQVVELEPLKIGGGGPNGWVIKGSNNTNIINFREISHNLNFQSASTAMAQIITEWKNDKQGVCLHIISIDGEDI
jgi:serine/threonine protein kinase